MARTVPNLSLTEGEVATAAREPAWRRWAARYHWAVVLLIYTAITLIITYPLIFHLGDRIIGPFTEGDNLWYVWYLWWFRQALLTGQDPAYTHMIYALTPSVQLFAASTFNGVMGALLESVMSPLAAYNLLMLSSFALSGLTMYLLASEFVQNRLACFMAGFIFTFSEFHFGRATGHLDLATLEWLPFCFWRVFVFYRRPTWANAIWMGVGLALVPLTDLYLTAYVLLPFALLFVIGKLVSDRAWFAQPRHLLLGGMGVAVALALAVPPLLSSLHVDPAMQAAIADKADSTTRDLSSDFTAFFLPNPYNPLLGWATGWLYARMRFGFTNEQMNYLGWISLGLGTGALAFLRNRTRLTAFWALLGVGGFLIALGPVLHVAGRPRLPLPFYNLLYSWPVLSNFRAPNRAGPLVLLPLTLLAAYGVQALWQRFVTGPRSRALFALLAIAAMGLSLSEQIVFSLPFPAASLHVPALYAQMAADPVPGLVLDLPVDARGSDQFYQTIHHRALVAGYAIRVTDPMALSIDNLPYLDLLYATRSAVAHDATAPTDVGLHDIVPLQETFLQGLQDAHVRYVVLHPSSPTALVYPWMRTFLLGQMGTPWYDNVAEGILAWRIEQVPPDPSVYRFEFGNGWSPGMAIYQRQIVRTVTQDAQLSIEAPQAGVHQLTVQAYPLLGARTMVVSLNGTTVGTVRYSSAGVFQTFDLGQVMLQRGSNVLQIHSAEGCTRPNDLNPDDADTRCLSFNVSQIQLSGLQEGA